MATNFPEHAVEVIKQQNLKGPLYNDLQLGRIFDLVETQSAVSMDGRTNVYGRRKDS